MAQTSTLPRSWDWKPSPFSNTMLALLLRIPVLHRLLSNQILLLSFKGRKSGKPYTIPLGYTREGDRVIILTKSFRGWWHNFESLTPVELLIAGERRYGTAQAINHLESSIKALSDVLKLYPYQADFYGLSKEATTEDIRRVAAKLIVIRVTLDNEAYP